MSSMAKGGIRWGFGIILGCSHYPSTRGDNWKTERTRDTAGMGEASLEFILLSSSLLEGSEGV